MTWRRQGSRCGPSARSRNGGRERSLKTSFDLPHDRDANTIDQLKFAGPNVTISDGVPLQSARRFRVDEHSAHQPVLFHEHFEALDHCVSVKPFAFEPEITADMFKNAKLRACGVQIVPRLVFRTFTERPALHTPQIFEADIAERADKFISGTASPRQHLIRWPDDAVALASGIINSTCERF